MQSSINPDEVRELLSNLKKITPTIPDEITKYLLQSVGCDITDESSIRLVSIAAQRYITELISKSVDYQKQRQLSESAKEKSGKSSEALLLQDLQNALHDM
ncbi:uncharacterized protein [Blastocystis hominis]|uniref:Transcription initiation factor TFIID subunit 10 n=1 Tax=Blastocystis hominis TaxID=12968 RepID=D8M7M2_BLAHO|nr:uncharacterized protein [Blastocystis hominis]CBK24061.2 unnamed protein product [Blastocystis hominis]|eukprot:XP_012898109.1 uncharacterized protein [Blastocystis hominis]